MSPLTHPDAPVVSAHPPPPSWASTVYKGLYLTTVPLYLFSLRWTQREQEGGVDEIRKGSGGREGGRLSL